MNAGRVLCSILLGMYAIYIIRNNTITIAGANVKKSLVLTMIQLGQLLMIELMVIFGGTILHSFSIFLLIRDSSPEPLNPLEFHVAIMVLTLYSYIFLQWNQNIALHPLIYL